MELYLHIPIRILSLTGLSGMIPGSNYCLLESQVFFNVIYHVFESLARNWMLFVIVRQSLIAGLRPQSPSHLT